MSSAALYARLPIAIQELALTVVNQGVLWKKFGPALFPWRSKMPLERLSEVQARRRLEEFLGTVRESIPAYRSMPKPSGTSLVEMLGHLPLLPKADFKARSAEFVSPKANALNSVGFRTSGSTGSPLRGRIARADLRHRFLNLLAWYRELGLDVNMRWARFGGMDLLGSHPGGRPDRVDWLRRHQFLSVYHISESTVRSYYEALLRNRTEVLEGYPSALGTLARLFWEAGLEPLSLRAVITTAESLSPEQSQWMERAFRVGPIEYYGSNEMSPLFVGSPGGGLELVSGTGLVELLDEDNLPVRQPGELGRMVVTSFDSHAMPLIRYEIGDLAEYESGGVHDLRVRRIVGRIDEVVRGPDGREIGRLSTALKYLPDSVVEAQIIVRSDGFRLVYVAPWSLGEEELASFSKHMLDKVGDVPLTFERVAEIPAGPRGKRPAVLVQRD